MQNFADSVKDRLEAAGCTAAEFISASEHPSHFGNAEAFFGLGQIVLRFVRDRDQEFMDLACRIAPAQFFQFDDVEVALGWKTVKDVLAKREPEPLDAVMARLLQRQAELEAAFSEGRAQFTRARIAKSSHDRATKFMKSLRSEK